MIKGTVSQEGKTWVDGDIVPDENLRDKRIVEVALMS